VLVRYPTEESLRAVEADEEDEVDVELVPLEEAQLQMTERAAEVRLFVGCRFSAGRLRESGLGFCV
jgi:hypothetical protein